MRASELESNPKYRRIVNYIYASIHYYGFTTVEQIVENYNFYIKTDETDFNEVNQVLKTHESTLIENFSFIWVDKLIVKYDLYKSFDHIAFAEKLDLINKSRNGLLPYRPKRTTFQAHNNYDYIEKDNEMFVSAYEDMKTFLSNYYTNQGIRRFTKKMTDHIVWMCKQSIKFDDVRKILDYGMGSRETDKLFGMQKFIALLENLWMNTSCYEKFGYTRNQAKEIQTTD